jgi:hypothetical protein
LLHSSVFPLVTGYGAVVVVVVAGLVTVGVVTVAVTVGCVTVFVGWVTVTEDVVVVRWGATTVVAGLAVRLMTVCVLLSLLLSIRTAAMTPATSRAAAARIQGPA